MELIAKDLNFADLVRASSSGLSSRASSEAPRKPFLISSHGRGHVLSSIAK